MEECYFCGKSFEPEPEGWSSFCSDECAEAQRAKETAEDRAAIAAAEGE